MYFYWLVWNWDIARVSLWRRMDWTPIHATKAGSIHSLKSLSRPEPIREADCEVMLPLTFDEAASLLLMRPRAGERPCFMSWHDSNTNIRSWHRASLSEGERAERGWVGGRVQDDRKEAQEEQQQHRQTDTTQAYKLILYGHRHLHMDTQANVQTKTQSRGRQTWNVKQASLCCGWILPKAKNE